jgi:hypothetical protein
MKRSYNDKLFRTIDPNHIYAWNWMPSKGKSGGILCGVKIEKFEVNKVNEYEFALSAEITDKKTKEKTKLVTVYGPAHDGKKEQFLSELSNICAKDDLPMLLGGDFNIQRYSDEKTNHYVEIGFLTCSTGL